MKVLTLHQPWATLVILGFKKLETRSWGTDYRGVLAIHASVNDRDLQNYLRRELFPKLRTPFTTAVTAAIQERFPDYPMEPWDWLFPQGEILGTVSLDAIYKEYPPYELTPREKLFGSYGAKRKAWELSNPVRFEQTIPARGALGLWNWEAAR